MASMHPESRDSISIIPELIVAAVVDPIRRAGTSWLRPVRNITWRPDVVTFCVEFSLPPFYLMAYRLVVSRHQKPGVVPFPLGHPDCQMGQLPRISVLTLRFS